jgi:hypothetical protein
MSSLHSRDLDKSGVARMVIRDYGKERFAAKCLACHFDLSGRKSGERRNGQSKGATERAGLRGLLRKASRFSDETRPE